jgi:hypothetical protein
VIGEAVKNQLVALGRLTSSAWRCSDRAIQRPFADGNRWAVQQLPPHDERVV